MAATLVVTLAVLLVGLLSGVPAKTVAELTMSVPTAVPLAISANRVTLTVCPTASVGMFTVTLLFEAAQVPTDELHDTKLVSTGRSPVITISDAVAPKLFLR